jgi:hypothetical protein
MYTVVAVFMHKDVWTMECYGPFKTKKEAKRQAKAIKWPCTIFIEYLWGNITKVKL